MIDEFTRLFLSAWFLLAAGNVVYTIVEQRRR
jgi:hypothetical protein